MKPSKPIDLARYLQSVKGLCICYFAMTLFCGALEYTFYPKRADGFVIACGVACVWVVFHTRILPANERAVVFWKLMILNAATTVVATLLGVPILDAIEGWLSVGLFTFVIGALLSIFGGPPEVPNGDPDLLPDQG